MVKLDEAELLVLNDVLGTFTGVGLAYVENYDALQYDLSVVLDRHDRESLRARIGDEAARRTMDAFYRAHLARGLAPAAALRAAKLELRTFAAGDGTRGVAAGAGPSVPAAASPAGHPCNWAPFICVGSAR